MAQQNTQQITNGNRGMGYPTTEYDNHGWKLYLASMIMIISAGIFVILRCSTRLWFSKFGWDDAMIVISLGFSIVVSVAIQLAISHGYGMHKADLAKDELRMALELFFVAQTPYKVTVCLNKVATLLLYLRIFTSQKFRVATFIAMGIIVAGSIGAIFATIFQCIPVAAAWDTSIKAKCIDSGQFWVAYAVMNVITDVVVLCLPMPMIRYLSLGRRDRVLLYCLFLLGGLVTITSILRTTSVQNSINNKMDITFNFIPRGIWTLVEANLGIIVPCLVVLQQPLSIFFTRAFGPTKARSAFRKPEEDDEKGFKLSDLSTVPPDSGLWRGSNLAQLSVFISGPESNTSRHSDEHHIVFDVARDSDSELDGKMPIITRGISKTVELTRTSVHQDRGYYHTGSYTGGGAGSETSIFTN